MDILAMVCNNYSYSLFMLLVIFDMQILMSAVKVLMVVHRAVAIQSEATFAPVVPVIAWLVTDVGVQVCYS